jgi:hypothetical protein
VAERKAFLLRLDPAVYDAMQRWAADDLRSINAQIDYVVRRALQQQGRLKVAPAAPADSPGREDDSTRG